MKNQPTRASLLLASIVCLMVSGQVFAESKSDIESAGRFLTTYCVDCHTGDDASGERDLESLSLNSDSEDSLILTQEIIDQLTLGAMPPPDADQPDSAQIQRAIEQLTANLRTHRVAKSSTGGQTVLRRLSQREYLETIGDLFDMDMSMFDPTTKFPRDSTVEHLDNIGDSLVMSSYLLEQYLDAADAIVEKAFRERAKPAEQSWHFKGRFPTQPELSIAHRRAFNYRYMCLYDCPLADKPEGAYGSIKEFEHGVPYDGIYEIKVLAQALHHDSPYDPEQLKIDLSEPFRMGIRPGNHEVGELHVVQPIQPLLAETIIDEGDPQWYTLRVFLDRGFTPRFTFENGMNGMRNLHTRFHRIYNNTLPKEARGGAGIVVGRNAMLKHGKMPQIRIHEIAIRGPLIDQWPQQTRDQLLPSGEISEAEVESVIRRFAGRAFRRPVRDDEVDRLLAIYQSRRDQGRSLVDAIKDSYKAALCSPSFLYFHPECEPGTDRLQQHALAERLAYFLTSSMPDERLRSLADDGKLDSETLLAETRRLMAGEKFSRMIEGFTDSWLGLRALGEMPPDRGKFWEYYARGLEVEMKRESQLFLANLIEHDLPLTDCLDADYSFVNRDLAKLYGVESQVKPDDAVRFRQVNFEDAKRGGILGHASVLTVSANGIETSPVIRGVWMLENVLGTPPPPPPDDVPAIDPDVRGAKGIKDLLEKHRTLDTCNQCHRKIDPLGFALECFDPIGQVRYRYPNRTDIDTSGQLPGGKSFEGPAGLKESLLERKEFFARAFTNKLFAYAIGRRMEPSDRWAIDQLLSDLEDQNYPTRTLVERVVASELFTRR
ncbi:DUF1592 domain-containing protein [Stieleria sp. JC731]|uniref:DUF1592 domain-containing protein n=1 Tax=Pirellulaceae TaxID=2691357 RepID=UPI001E3687B2|nr:DUF1592 domain-containing protein [Stieleria sp. JC731]MCC9601985.1 DUF1592 domain-containing protein [Stieleria sp. JC731]